MSWASEMDAVQVRLGQGGRGKWVGAIMWASEMDAIQVRLGKGGRGKWVGAVQVRLGVKLGEGGRGKIEIVAFKA